MPGIGMMIGWTSAAPPSSCRIGPSASPGAGQSCVQLCERTSRWRWATSHRLGLRGAHWRLAPLLMEGHRRAGMSGEDVA